MTEHLRRAALAALTLACILLPRAPADAQAARPSVPSVATGTATPPRLPAASARPPATRRPSAAAPATPAPARPTVVAVKPAANPAPMPATGTLAANGETWAQISAEAVNAGAHAFPVGRGHMGPSVLRVQVLLDRALFSPGMIDGRWGKNTQNALYWLQAREGLPATGTADSATYARLTRLAGAPRELVRAHTLTADEVRGPFTAIPADIYEQARLSCSCYESLTEKLTETFHASRELLAKLNPGARLDSLKAGDVLNVPNVRDAAGPPAGTVAALVVSGPDNYLQALDAQGRIVYHFPTTLGSSYDPSPEGDFRVVSIHENPWWRYQPKILAHVPDDLPDANIPPGPNSAVGKVWMSLSAPHYGIHGTKSPETIGYAQSAGCVRLTNWDALYLSRRIAAGVPVQFRATRTRTAAPAAAPAAREPAQPAVLGARADSARADSAKPAAPRDSVRLPAAKPDSARADSARPAPAAAPKPDSAPPAPSRDSAKAPTQPAAPAPAPATPPSSATPTTQPAPAKPAATPPAPAQTPAQGAPSTAKP